jgi:methylenetetrahydrofolate--tRNA-(uracil-5-)-methyltransferase
MSELIVIGGGLAGSEAAWQAAQRGVEVDLYEMRPNESTGAHISADLAELICSNSLGSNLPDRASGLLKNELRRLDSLLIRCADMTSVPAGNALSVDRSLFSRMVTESVESHPNIRVIRQEWVEIPEKPSIIASGPLTSPRFAEVLAEMIGEEYLYFFDAISPIVSCDSIDMSIAYKASRYQRDEAGAGDYINCPMTRNQYDFFVSELLAAETVALKSFETEIKTGVKAGLDRFFEGCLPVEVIAGRGHKALAFGPLRPVGLRDPRTGLRPYAVVQLRQDNLMGTLYNMVGFQTNLKFPEQERVFRLIPSLENAVFTRYGQMHRNTYLFSPRLLRPTLQYVHRDDLFFAGQITGVEGYAGNIATGLLAGWNAARLLRGLTPVSLPATTMIGALCRYITRASPKDFQPMKANFGLLPMRGGEDQKMSRRFRALRRAQVALDDLDAFLQESLN